MRAVSSRMSRDLYALLADALELSPASPACTAAPAWCGEDELVVCVDTMVEGVHFPARTPPDALAHKLLAVNVSDLAAMAAEPLHALLSLCAGEGDSAWFAAFAAGMADASRQFTAPVRSLDITDGPLTLTLELHGRVPRGTALRRDGAQPGDLVFVTGTLGDAAASLAAWRGELTLTREDEALLRARLERPTPRLAAGRQLRGIANACIDVSDGLGADLGHILEASGVGARIEVEHLPLSAPLLRSLPRERALDLALTGGDDYELCFCVAPRHQALLAARAPYLECAIRCIGRIEQQAGLRCVGADGSPRPMRGGWMHFGAASQ